MPVPRMATGIESEADMAGNRSTAPAEAVASDELHAASVHFAEGKRLLERARRRRRRLRSDPFLGMLTVAAHRLILTIAWFEEGRRRLTP